MQSDAKTVKAYLASLPADRRAAVTALREVILANLPKGYEEGMQYGMIGYHVPHRLYPAGYHTDPSQPVPFAALASQKNNLALYLMGVYCGCVEPETGETAEATWFREVWRATGKRLDMGKSCVRFRRLEDVPLEVVAEAIRRVPVALLLERYQAGLAAQGTAAGRTRAKPGAAKGAAKGAPKRKASAATRSSPRRAGSPAPRG